MEGVWKPLQSISVCLLNWSERLSGELELHLCHWGKVNQIENLLMQAWIYVPTFTFRHEQKEWDSECKLLKWAPSEGPGLPLRFGRRTHLSRNSPEWSCLRWGQLRWFKHLVRMPSRCFAVKVDMSCGSRPRGKIKTCWKYCM